MTGNNAPDPVTPDEIMTLGLSFLGAKTLLAAVELGLFTELARGGSLGAEALAERLGLHARGKLDFLDALVALRMLERTDRLYSDTPATEQYLDRAKPTYVGGRLEHANARLYRFWGSLTDALRTGEPQSEAKHGEGDLFVQLYADPERLGAFLRGMSGNTVRTARALAANFPWPEYRSFIDVGAAEGAVAVQLALAHPHLRGAGFDLPGVRPHFEALVADHELTDRVGFHSGDFFTDPLPTADVIIMGHILHDWNLDQKRELLAKAYVALQPGGALIVYEALIDDDRRENTYGLLMSLNMLIETRGGFDFTAADGIGWMRQAGFRETWAESLVGPERMIVGKK